MYHRVAKEATDPWSLCVSPDHFEEQLRVLKKRYHTMQFRSFTESLRIGKIPDQSIVITFDDGYADNLYEAKPLLEKHGIEATVFLVTGCIGTNRQFWSDELETLLLHPGQLPGTFRLEINETVFEKELQEGSQYTEEAYERFRSWKASESPPTKRHSFYYWLWEQLRPFPDELRRGAIDELWDWAGVQPPSNFLRRALTQNEVRSLCNEGLIEIGSHTETHPRLASIRFENQRVEINQSKAILEELTGKHLESFAYPYGWHGDYTPESVALVKIAGYTGACTTIPAVANEKSDPFQLPRMQVQNWNGDEFENHLQDWFSALGSN
jgi:peptidoglycan/xylan/chitin deacetylase (PgdA/CDA1 family)